MELKREHLPWIIGGAGALVVFGFFGILLMQKPAQPQAVAVNNNPPAAEPTKNAPAGEPKVAASSPSAAAEPEATTNPAPAESKPFTVSDDEVAKIRTKLKSIAIAFHNHHDTRKSFSPVGRGGAPPQLSWRVFLLPFLEQDPLYRRFKLDEPWDSPNNLELLQYMPEIYRSGQDNGNTTRFVVLTGEDALFHPNRRVSVRDCRDGTSNTVLVMHAGGGTAVPWTKPEDVAFDLQNPLRGVGPVNDKYEMAMADAAVLELPVSAGPDIFAALVTPHGGEIIDGMAIRNGRIPKITGRKPIAVANRSVESSTNRASSPPAPNRAQGAGTEAPHAQLASVPLSAAVPKVLVLPHPGFNFAYDELTGHLMTIEQSENEVSLYSLENELKAVASAPAPAHPTAVAAKQYKGQSYFAVGDKLDTQLNLFNAKDGSLVRTINLPFPTVIDLGGSRASEDPYLYYTILNKDQQPFFIGRIDIAKQVDDGCVSFERTTDFAVSADGTIAYVRDAASSPTGFTSMRLAPRDPETRVDGEFKLSTMALETVFHDHRSAEKYVPDPLNSMAAEGKSLYSATLTERLGEFEFPVYSFLPGTPWVIGVSDGKLYIASINDKRSVAAVQLPPEFAPTTPDQRQLDQSDWVFSQAVRPIQVFADATRGRIIVATKDRVVVVEVKSLGLPDEPLLNVQLEGPKSVSVSKPVEFTVKSFDKRAATRLVSAPKGAEWKDGVIRWTPTDADLGLAKLVVERTFDRLRIEQTFSLPVRRDFVPLPLPARHVSLSSDGKLAVVWSQIIDGGSSEIPPGQNLAVVDVEAGTVRASQRIEKKVWTAAIDSQGVYVLTQEANISAGEVLRLSVDDLKLVKAADIPHEQHNNGLPRVEPFAGKFLVAANSRYTLPDLEPISPKSASSLGIMPSGPVQGRAFCRLSNVSYLDGIIWQEDMEKPRLLYRPQSFIGLPGEAEQTELTSWGVTVKSGFLQGPPFKKLVYGSENDTWPRVISQVPAVLVLRTRAEETNRQSFAAIDVYDLVDGARVRQIILKRNDQSANYAALRYQREYALDTAGGVAAACVDGKLFFVPLAEIRAPELRKPFRFQLAQSPIVLGADATTKAQYELTDGEPPYDVTLSIGEERMRQSARDTVSFSIDGRRVAAYLADRMAHLSWPLRDTQYTTPPTPQERVVDYIESATAAFRKITGRSPKGVPVVIPVTLEATDAKLRTVRMDHVFLIELSTPRVIERLANPEGAVASRNRRSPRNDALASRTKTRPIDPARQRQIAEVNTEVAVDYSQKIRKAHPPDKINEQQIDRLAKQGRKESDELLARNFKRIHDELSQQNRTWSDRKGHTTEARMKSAFADNVILVQPSGKEITVPIEKLSDADQAFIAQSQKTDDLSDNDHAAGRMHTLLDAMIKHVRRESRFPPAFIVDDHGRPLLSWRVALLPDLGAKDLFALFHFNEPWDSPNNRKLLAYMPAVFAGGAQAAGMTPFVCFRSPESVLSGGNPLSLREISDPQNLVVVFGEVRENRAVPWTEPRDLGVDEFDKLAQVLHEREGQRQVGLADGTVRALPISTSADTWRQVINRADGEPLDVQFADPPTGSAMKPSSTMP